MDDGRIKSSGLRPGGDVVLWFIAVILAALSVLVVYSSTGVEALNPDGSGNHFGVLVRQLVIVAMGLVVVYLVHKVDYQIYGRVVWFAYGVALAFTVLVYFIGEANAGAAEAPRWIRVPVINMTFQPSDFLKVATVMVLARELARRQKGIDRQRILPPFSRRGWREEGGGTIVRENSMPLLAPIAVSCVVIFPSNLSTSLILFVTCLVMLFIGRVRIRELGKTVFAFMLAAALGIGFLYAIGHPPKRMATWTGRVERFFDLKDQSTMSAAQIARDEALNHQIEQAEIAIAAGGLTGRGAGESTQRWILPEAESDYAYAFVIEEYGALVGGLLVILLYLWIFFRGIAIFRKCGTAFPSLLVLGLALLITLQAMINMMVATNMIPPTGIALPLISKGGSSELFLSLALGMMLGVSRQTSDQTLDRPKAESLLE